MSDQISARYSDGRTALLADVRVDVEQSSLRILDLSGSELARWPCAGLYLAEEVYRNQPVRLLHKDAGAACLTLENRDLLHLLSERSPFLRQRSVRLRQTVTVRGIALTVAAAVSLIALAAWGLPGLANVLMPYVPMSWSRTIGDQFVAAMEQTYPACASRGDEDGTRAIEDLVQRLMHAAGAQGAGSMDVSVVVLDSPIPNALTAPGGRILVFRGILKLAKTPEQLAGVLAHEVSHALAHDPERGMARAVGWRSLFGVLFGSSAFAQSSLQSLLALSYTRDAERMADRHAIELLEREGIRSDGLPEFLATLAADSRLSGRGVPAFLASHPNPEERARDLRGLINPRIRGKPWSPKQWNAIQGLCARPKALHARRAAA